MTIDELKAMTPEQINAMVAERVMGWEKSQSGDYWIDDQYLARYPATNIADAWLVVEKLYHEHVPAITILSPLPMLTPIPVWTCWFGGPSASAATVELAICYAALLHVGVRADAAIAAAESAGGE